VSVAELFAGLVSVNPLGAVTETVLTSVPVPAGVVGLSVPVTEYVTVAAAGIVADVAIELPEPDAVAQVAPPVAAHVHVTPVRAAGTTSLIGADVAVDGPAFVTTMVYVRACPGIAAVRPSDFVTLRSPRGVTSSVSVAELFAGFVSVVPADAATVAVLTSVPMPAGVVATTVAVTV
jgi:hypothetical protein